MRASYEIKLKVSTISEGEFSVERSRYLATVAKPLPSTNYLAKSRDFSAVKTSLEMRLMAMGTFSLVKYLIELRVR